MPYRPNLITAGRAPMTVLPGYSPAMDAALDAIAREFDGSKAKPRHSALHVPRTPDDLPRTVVAIDSSAARAGVT